MVNFIGLGKLGLPLATCFAKNGVFINAVDTNADLIAKLNQGRTPWVEAGLADNIQRAGGNISYQSTYEKVAEFDTTIILVNTPSVKADGSFSNVYVEQSIIEICKALKEAGRLGHHFILSSTVMPRTILQVLIPLIENVTGWSLRAGNFGFSYVPDFVALGNVINDFENPDFLMIGSSSQEYALRAQELFQRIERNNAPVAHLNLSEAELAKVSLNAYITTKISFANFIKLYADTVEEEIDATKVAMTIGLDKRIGQKYFRPGAPYGGTCFPRDTWAFMRAAANIGLTSAHMIANEKVNESLVDSYVSLLVRSNSQRIGFYGLSFKEGTSVTTKGVAELICKKLVGHRYELYGYDPNPQAFEFFPFKAQMTFCSTIEDLSAIGCDVIFGCHREIVKRPECSEFVPVW
jgi:UDPglucose 6-dehydrogenase